MHSHTIMISVSLLLDILSLSLFQEWTSVSDEAKDLLRNLLQRDVKQRLSAKEVLNHPWLSHHPLPPETPLKTPEVLNMCVDRYS